MASFILWKCEFLIKTVSSILLILPLLLDFQCCKQNTRSELCLGLLVSLACWWCGVRTVGVDWVRSQCSTISRNPERGRHLPGGYGSTTYIAGSPRISLSGVADFDETYCLTYKLVWSPSTIILPPVFVIAIRQQSDTLNFVFCLCKISSPRIGPFHGINLTKSSPGKSKHRKKHPETKTFLHLISHRDILTGYSLPNSLFLLRELASYHRNLGLYRRTGRFL